MAQPDLGASDNSLTTLGREVRNMGNVEALQQGREIQASLRQVLAELAALRDSTTRFQDAATEKLDALTKFMRETPMRTANTAAGVAGPLRGPNGPLNGNIITRDAIGRASIRQLNNLAQQIGINWPEPRLNVDQKRAVVAEALGIFVP